MRTNADKHLPIRLNKTERKGIRPIQPWKDKGWYLFKMPEPRRISKLLCMIELYHQGKDKRFYIPYHVAKILPDQAIHALDDETGNTISLSFIQNGRPRYKKLFFFSIQADREAKKMALRRNKRS